MGRTAEAAVLRDLLHGHLRIRQKHRRPLQPQMNEIAVQRHPRLSAQDAADASRMIAEFLSQFFRGQRLRRVLPHIAHESLCRSLLSRSPAKNTKEDQLKERISIGPLRHILAEKRKIQHLFQIRKKHRTVGKKHRLVFPGVIRKKHVFRLFPAIPLRHRNRQKCANMRPVSGKVKVQNDQPHRFVTLGTDAVSVARLGKKNAPGCHFIELSRRFDAPRRQGVKKARVQRVAQAFHRHRTADSVAEAQIRFDLFRFQGNIHKLHLLPDNRLFVLCNIRFCLCLAFSIQEGYPKCKKNFWR